MRTFKFKTEEEKRIEELEHENADLWYQKILDQAKINNHEQEIADLWYEIIVGGAE